jgi:integrase
MILTEAAERFDLESPYKNIKPLKLQKIHIEPFSLDEVQRIINSVRVDFKNYYIVRFYTGMRTGEIDGLKWEFVDFSAREIIIRETLIKGRTEYTKTNGSQREIPMFGPVYEALKKQYAETGNTSEYVFCNRDGHPLDHCNVTNRVWYPLLRFLGMTKRRPYQTRHTAATLLLASGENDLLPVNRAPVVGDFRLLGVRVDTRTVSDRLANYAACIRCNLAATLRFFLVRL